MSIEDFITSPDVTHSPAADGAFRAGWADGERAGRAIMLATILGIMATEADARELSEHLRRVHDGTDRGGLLALLQRLWGVAHEKRPSGPKDPTISEDDRALAKRLADRGDYALADSIRECDEDFGEP